MKKFLAVFLCVAMMMSFVTLVASASDAQAVLTEDTAIGAVLTEGESTSPNFWDFLSGILGGANWTNIFAILIQTIGTIIDMFGNFGK